MPVNPEKRKELEDRILSKRQQIEFERNEIEADLASSEDSRENPDVKEEMISPGQSAINDIDATEMKSLENAEKELQDLIKELDELSKD